MDYTGADFAGADLSTAGFVDVRWSSDTAERDEDEVREISLDGATMIALQVESFCDALVELGVEIVGIPHVSEN